MGHARTRPHRRSAPLHAVAAAVAVAVAATASLALLPAIAHAEPGAAAADASLHQALGGRIGLERLVDDFVRRMVEDPRTAAHFKDVDLVQLRRRLADQVCEVSGGPCRYDGKDMKTVHEGTDITRAHFNAVVEMLQDAMDAQRVPFREQNRLLARLAPMHRQIVNAPAGAASAPAR